ncbi:unnamed protein product [Pocillopora meandrina]|uniref:THD domain-containing protein n=1 Tax=Pocillopora meandrina TaxID=46732 RepID=A0AAU9XEX4_9CNID|nr:unnamed protein product [Pocillopora meandrina]
MAFLEVKILLSCVFLIYTNVEAAPSPKNPYRPLGHIEASSLREVSYEKGQEITDWDMENGYSLLEGGMIYADGHLKVPEDGVYYVYAQLYFHSTGRVRVFKNYEEPLTMANYPDVSEGSKYAGGAFRLEAGDTISLEAATSVKLYMAPYHSYFGAFLLQ